MEPEMGESGDRRSSLNKCSRQMPTVCPPPFLCPLSSVPFLLSSVLISLSSALCLLPERTMCRYGVCVGACSAYRLGARRRHSLHRRWWWTGQQCMTAAPGCSITIHGVRTQPHAWPTGVRHMIVQAWTLPNRFKRVRWVPSATTNLFAAFQLTCATTRRRRCDGWSG
jgi:hypothetical protein